jgi:FkbM family methyltransferase
MLKAFEVDPTTFQLLCKNVADNSLNVETYNCALWDEDTNVDFFVDSHRPGSLLMSIYGSRINGERITVPANKLSAFIRAPVDFLKLDVEGSEHRVLRELVGSGTLALIRQMVVEYHHRIGDQKSSLGGFLLMLEQAGFEYQIHAALYPVTSKNAFQDMLIVAYR